MANAELLPRVELDPRDPGFYLDPYPHYSNWHRDHGRFFWTAYDRVCFAGFDDVDRILRDRRFGRALPDTGVVAKCPISRAHLQRFDAVEEFSLLNLEPPRHTALRKLVNRAFVSSKVEHLRPEIESIARGLIDNFLAEGQTDLLKSFLMPLPAVVIARLLGVPEDNVSQLLHWSHAMVKVYTLTQSHQQELEADQAAGEFTEFLQYLIDKKRQTQSDDLLGHLLRVEVDGQRLSDAEIVSVAVLLLNAGHEASVHQSGNAIKTLIQHKLEPSQVFQSPESTAEFIEEMLRFDAPLHLFMRYALEPVDMGNGLVLEKGEEVALLLGAANRDPCRFKQPDLLWPGRPDSGHVSFGAGLHFCLGAPLARLEMQVSLPLLFQRLPQMRLVGQPRYADSFHFHGLDSLKVQWG